MRIGWFKGIAWLSCLTDDEALALVAKQGFGPRADYGPKAPQTPEALQLDMPVEVTFKKESDEISLPLFQPVKG